MKSALLTFLVFASACESPAELLPPPPAEQGFQLGMDVDVEPGQEAWKCKIMTLDVEGQQNVNRVRHIQSASVHHMDVAVIMSSGLNKPPGIYDCKDLYEQFPKLMEEIILYGSQSDIAELTLPKGVVAGVPPGLTLMYELHHVNATNKKVHLQSRMNAYTIPQGEIKDTIWGGVVRDRFLNIPPGQHTEWSRCTFDQDVDVIVLSSHTHELGRSVSIFPWDGKTTTGDQVFINKDWQAPKILQLPEPMHVKQGEGFEFHCLYDNDRGETITWGPDAKDEMCSMVVVFTPGKSNARCTVVETSDGTIME